MHRQVDISLEIVTLGMSTKKHKIFADLSDKINMLRICSFFIKINSFY